LPSRERIRHLLVDDRSAAALAVAERHAHGLTTQRELTNAFWAAEGARMRAVDRRGAAERLVTNAAEAVAWERCISLAAAATAVVGATERLAETGASAVITSVAEALVEEIVQEIGDCAEVALGVARARLAALVREHFPYHPPGAGSQAEPLNGL
jgi:dihydroxyacetone kinase